MKPKSKVLIIAGSDSSGGAGIQADIKTITALGSYAMTAITAVTAQNTRGVKSIVPIKPKEISNQIIFTSNDIKPDAVKIGILHSSEVIKSIMLGVSRFSSIIFSKPLPIEQTKKSWGNKPINVAQKKFLILTLNMHGNTFDIANGIPPINL